MFDTFSRSWSLTKLSWGVIKQDKELLLYPLLSVLLSIGWLMALFYPIVWAANADDGTLEFSVVNIIITFITYLGWAFIGTFFNVCIVYTAKKRFEGGDATFGESIKYSLGKIHLILGWATVSATVGLLLNALDQAADRVGGAGGAVLDFLRRLLGAVWSVITMFVVPAMVYKGLTPIPAIKDSVRVLKETWGESVVRSIGFGLIRWALLLVGIFGFGGLFAVLNPTGALATALMVVAVTYIVGVIFLFFLLEMIFNTALYNWATNGVVAPGYSEELFQNAVKEKA